MEEFVYDEETTLIFSKACKVANALNHDWIGGEHLLSGMFEVPNRAQDFLKKLGGGAAQILSNLQDRNHAGPEKVTIGKLPESPSAKKALKLADSERVLRNGDRINSIDLLIGLILEGRGMAYEVLVGALCEIDYRNKGDMESKIAELLNKIRALR